MQRDEEKRRNDRLPCRSPVAWAYFNKAEMHAGQLRDFSSYGASFECSQAPVHGATILLRLENYPSECRSGCQEKTECPWPRSIVLGDVKWCHDMPSSGLPLFGIGVKFHVSA
jgi:hypothetical protein